MEKGNSSAEGSPMKNESPASTSKSAVSVIQINSIAIDICCPMEEIEPPMQEHFSIRGFVAEARNKNPQMPSPFHSETETDKLPPLSVPRFRWWQCSHCIPEHTAEKNDPAENQNDAPGTSSHKAIAEEEDSILLSNSKRKGNKEQGPLRISRGRYPYDNIAEPIPFWIRHQPDKEEEYPSTRADGPDNGSSGSSDGFVPLLTRRKKKLRSLADIMEEEKNSASGHMITGSASSNGTHVTVTTTEADAKLGVLPEDGEVLRNPCRKKRTAREDMRENLETSHLMGEAKRSKVHVEPKKTSRGVVISDSEAETVASERLDLQVSSGIRRVKHKKYKIFRERGKQKQAEKDNRTALENNSTYDSLWKATGILGPVPEKASLNLSLSSSRDAERRLLDEKSLELRDIPDLNESIIEKTPMIQETQLPPVVEKCSLAHEKMMVRKFLIGTEADDVEGRRQADVNSRDNTAELGGSVDDIPMEIVELLAKNQQERELENSRQHFSPRRMTSSGGETPAVYVDGVPGIINFPYSSMTNAASFVNRNTSFGQGALNFPQGKYFQPEACHPGTTSQFRLFTPLVPIQQYNAAYLGSHPVVSEPRTIERADLLWHSSRKSMPFNVSVGQNCLIPPNGFPVHPLPDQFSKGKNICNMSNIEKPDASAVKEGRIQTGPSSVGLLDAYSNVDIPAMQLLSLTNLRNGGFSSFIDKPPSTLIQHPNLNLVEGKDHLLIGSPFFPLTKQLPQLLNAAPLSGERFTRSPLPAQIPALKGCSRDTQSIQKENPKQLPSPNDASSQVCVVSRNPADFTILDASNEYMINARALNFKKRNACKQKLPSEVPKRNSLRRGSSRDQAATTAHNSWPHIDSHQQQHKIKNARIKNPPKKSGRQNL